jgi:hypothetical protein
MFDADNFAFGVELVGLGIVRIGVHRRDAKIRPLHPERLEQRVLHEVFPTALGDLAAEVSRRHVHQVVVLKSHPQIAAQLEEGKAMVNLFAGQLGAVPDRVMPWQSAAMRDQIARRDV